MLYKLIRFSLVMILLNACVISAQQNSETNKTNWPSFRGLHAEAIAENYTIPISWSVEKNKNIKWKTEIPGLGHSSPVI